MSIKEGAVSVAGRVVGKITSSFASLLASPSVWIAASVVFVGGFSAGHLSRQRVVHRVAVERDDAVRDNERLTVSLRVAQSEARDLADKLAAASKELAAIKLDHAKKQDRRRLK